MTDPSSSRPSSDGLEGIVAARTVLSHADGERGIVWVRGRTIDDLVSNHGYEGAIALLWDGFAGDRPRPGAARERPHDPPRVDLYRARAGRVNSPCRK
jgi:citrate synthase